MKNMRFVRDSGPYKAGEIHTLDDQTALDVFVAGDACNTEEAPNAILQPVIEVHDDAGEDKHVAAENEEPAEHAETEHAAAERDAPETAAAAAAPETK